MKEITLTGTLLISEEEKAVVEKHFNGAELTEDEQWILNNVKDNLLCIVLG